MANNLPNLVDWARRADPEGKIAKIAEVLSQCNEILKDMLWSESNAPMSHTSTVRTSLPQGTWRNLNQGVQSTKSNTAQFTDGLGELSAYSFIDRSIAELNGEVAAFRWSEDMAFIEGMSQQVATALFYSNEATAQNQFTGLAPRYNTISTSTALSAANVIDAGGTGSSNASIWLVGHGNTTTFGLFPKGSKAGLIHEDKGDIVPVTDASGNQFEAYRSFFRWQLGLCVRDWRYNARIANIDTTTAGLQGTAPYDIFAGMSKLVVRLPTASRRLSGITESDAATDPVPGTNPIFYVNRTVREFMDIQAIRDKNVLIDSKEYAGSPVVTFRETPIRVVDALLSTEARIV